MRNIIVLGLGFSVLALLGLGWYKTSVIKRDVEVRFPPLGKFVSVQSERVHLVDIGPRDAPPEKTIVLLHGATSNLRDGLNSVGKPLSADYRIIAVDRPGHGWSSREGGAKDASLDVQARIITEALSNIGVQNAVIMGHSLAGALVMKLALDYPKFVSAIVLISPVTHPWPGGIAWYHSVVSIPVVGDIFVYAISAPAGQSLLSKALESVFYPAIPPGDYLDKTGAELVFRPEEFRANSQDLKILYEQVVEQYPRYKGLVTPALILTSDVDTVVSPEIHARTLAKEMSNTKLVVLKDSGHAPQYSRTQDVLEEIRRFIER